MGKVILQKGIPGCLFISFSCRLSGIYFQNLQQPQLFKAALWKSALHQLHQFRAQRPAFGQVITLFLRRIRQSPGVLGTPQQNSGSRQQKQHQNGGSSGDPPPSCIMCSRLHGSLPLLLPALGKRLFYSIGKSLRCGRYPWGIFFFAVIFITHTVSPFLAAGP